MLTSFVFLLLVITFLLGLARCQKFFVVFSIITLIIFSGVGCGVIPALMLSQLKTENSVPTKWAGNNGIILLGEGTYKGPAQEIFPTILAYSRIHEAEKLYFSCKNSGGTCLVIISGGDPSHNGESEANVYKNELISLGIKSQDILLEENSLNTYQNAKFTSKILKRADFNHLFLVTSSIHMKRALLYFANFDIHPLPVIGGYVSPVISTTLTGYNFAIADFVAHEYAGIARLYLYNFLGWNG